MRHRRTQQTSKHKKIKAVDPFYSGPRRDAIFKADRNANHAPRDPAGGQEIPRKLREWMKAKQNKSLEQDGRKSNQAHRNSSSGSGPGGLRNGPPEFRQGKYETLTHFYRRMDKTAQEAITKAELETQFDVNFERQGKNKLVVSKRKDPVMLVEEETASASKSQKKKQKLKKRLDDKLALNRDEFAEMRDEFAFGETVQAPPTISAAPWKAPKLKQMGEKDLLLKRALTREPVEEPNPEPSLFDNKPRPSAIAIAIARQEELRQNAVDAYRKLRKRKKVVLPDVSDDYDMLIAE